jgi:hydrogenase nickel incorporation protein HypA/HybF
VHETALMDALMRRVREVAAAESAKRVVGVSVWLGALSHFSRTHFAEHFEEAARGTPAEGARLEIVLSEDLSHPDAQHIRLEGVEVET